MEEGTINAISVRAPPVPASFEACPAVGAARLGEARHRSDLTSLLTRHRSGGFATTCKASPKLLQLRLDLLQPEAHVHLAVHRGRACQVLLGLPPVAGAAVEPAQAEVTVGGEGTHPELVGPGEGLAVGVL